MIADSTDAEVFTLKQAAKRIPTRPSLCTIWRWATKGCRGVVLHTERIGGLRYTTQESLNRFFRELNKQPAARPDRSKAIDAAEREVLG
jgi:hypothetical protein